MSVHIKQLNADASFLLSFERTSGPASSGQRPTPFTILTDPWIVGPSKVFHPILAVSSHRQAACISTLRDLPEPDLVIISQHKSDHCNEPTLRQLPRTGTKTLILAVPAAAKLIKSWNHFDEDKIITIPRWEESSRPLGHKEPLVRVAVPSTVPGGDPGEVTVAYIAQKRDVSGLHAAIGITYMPPPAQGTGPHFLVTPPATPNHDSSSTVRRLASPIISPTAHALRLALPTPPASPSHSTRSTRSIHSLRSSQSSYSSPQLLRPASRGRDGPALSVIFSPHGISYRSLEPYVTSHLIPSSAFPLTALLHCFDSVTNPWWLGGNISAGAPAGQETAINLGARAWVSAHDGDKDIDGLMTKMLRGRRYAREEVQQGLAPEGKTGSYATETEVLMLGVGEEICVTREGVVCSQ
ncbi:uncharacterized protein DNG_00708 [Cephalotrichum gorgonifer]|uniref:Lactamase_B domain-containing protein n=1 Tax=Cephalotrichum gorgonifer TaxID=2041049 RepID=A0AAE8SR47_9PEZI|nr:uncharacterized protein DNG_00708 [Cephalotrichum gorgonifer]